MGGMAHQNRRGRACAARLRGRDRRHHRTEPRGGLFRDNLRRGRLAEAYMEPAPESCNAPVRFARSHPRIQDEILEHRRRGTGSHGRLRDGGVHDPLRRQAPVLSSLPRYDYNEHCCGRDMGFHPRVLQGEVEHQRDALHADDELHRNADSRLLLLQVVEPQGLGSHRSHQQRQPQRLASEPRRSGLPAQHTYRCGADRFHVHLSQIQQARL